MQVMGRMTRFLSEQVGLETWVATVLGILLATFVAHQLAALILRRAQRAAERTAIVWDDAVVRSTGKPLRIVIWVVGFGFVAKVLQGRVDTRFIEDVTELRNAAIIACVAWFALRFVQQVGGVRRACQALLRGAQSGGTRRQRGGHRGDGPLGADLPC